MVMTCDPPPGALLPLQPVPPATQDVGPPDVDHDAVTLPPELIEPGDTERATVGGGIALTDTAADPEPSLFAQVNEKV